MRKEVGLWPVVRAWGTLGMHCQDLSDHRASQRQFVLTLYTLKINSSAVFRT